MDDLLSIAVSNAVAATVLALAAIVVEAVYRRPALVHGLWLLVLLKLLTPPLLFLPISWPTAAELPPEVADMREETTLVLPSAVEEGVPLDVVAPAEKEEPAVVEGVEAVDIPGTPTQLDSPEPSLWPRLLSVVWGTGALIWFLVALERLHHFRRLLRFARPAPAALQERTRRLAHSLGLRRCPRVCLLPGRIAPMLWAVGGPPRLLLPADLLAGLSDEQLDTLLVHELAHLRRRDHWVRVLEFVVLGLYWWHPVVWYARRELREAEEQCCDAWVVSTLPGAGRTYASALLDTLDFLSTTPAAVPPLASGLSHIADLKRRLTMIMRGNTPRSLTWPGCLAVLTLGMTFLPMLPSLQGEPPTREDPNRSVEKAKKSLEAAKAELERAKANFEQEMAELAAIELQQRKIKAEKVAQLQLQAEKARRQVTIAEAEDKARQSIEGQPTIRIEIVLDANGINVWDLAQKLKAVIPQKHTEIKVAIPGGRIIEISPKNVPSPPPKRANVFPPAGVPVDQDKRINDLEKKLDKVLHELHDLRNQMKPPVSPSAYSPPAPR
ncbi:MAG: M56 family metallopeptidase [Gemmataceae bacterium]